MCDFTLLDRKQCRGFNRWRNPIDMTLFTQLGGRFWRFNGFWEGVVWEEEWWMTTCYLRGASVPQLSD